MANLNTLYVSKINNINIIQDGDSTVSAENNEADYSDPKGRNKIVLLGAGQENIAISFKTISDENTSALKKILRVGAVVTIVDKFKGKYRVTVSSYSIVDSDSHIGVTKFTASFKIKEDLKEPPQNLSSKLKSDSVSLANAIDMTMALNTVNVINSAVDSVNEKVGIFEEASNFATGALDKIGEYRNQLKGIVDKVASLVHLPAAFKNKILGVIAGFVAIYATARGAFEAARNIKTLFRDVNDSLSIFKRNEIDNSNVTVNATNIVKASIMLDLIPDITFESMEDAKDAQTSVTETLDAIADNDELVQTIKNDLSNYIQSLDLPNVVTIEVFKKPFLVLSYELYGTIDRVEQLRDLNNLFEDDNVTGSIKVFDR